MDIHFMKVRFVKQVFLSKHVTMFPIAFKQEKHCLSIVFGMIKNLP